MSHLPDELYFLFHELNSWLFLQNGFFYDFGSFQNLAKERNHEAEIVRKTVRTSDCSLSTMVSWNIEIIDSTLFSIILSVDMTLSGPWTSTSNTAGAGYNGT